MARTIRAAIYTRISLDRDGTSLSPARQEEDCRKLAEQRGWKVIRVYCDRNQSAFKKGKRPEYEQLMKDLGAGAYDALLVWRLDRLERGGIASAAPLLTLIEEEQLKFVALNDGIDTSGPNSDADQLRITMLAWNARRESKATSERQKRTHLQRAQAGKMHGGGRRVFGYERDGTIIPSEAKVLRQIIKWIIAGETVREVCRRLDDKGVTTSTGNKWNPATLGRMLRSPVMVGKRVHKGELYDGDWDPIIDEATHKQLMKVLARNKRPSGYRNELKHVLAGFVRCGLCGERMYVRIAPGDHERQRYTCTKKPGTPACGGCSIDKTHLEDLVAERLLDFFYSGVVPNSNGSTRVDVEVLEKELQDLEQRLIELTEDTFSNRTAGQSARAREAFRNAFKIESARLADQIAQVEEQLKAATSDRANAFIPDSPSTWWKKAPLTDRRAAVAAAIERIDIVRAAVWGRNKFDSDRVRITWHWDAWRTDLAEQRASEWWANASDQERAQAKAAYQREVDAANELMWAEQDQERKRKTRSRKSSTAKAGRAR